MKNLISALFALQTLALGFIPQAMALEVKVYGRDKIVYSSDTFVRADETVESISRRTIGQEHRISTDKFGVTAIDGLKQDTSVPGQGLGWCYAVDGKMPSKGFRELKLSNKNQKLVWFYGVSTQGADGQWTECKPFYAHSSTILN